MKTLRGFVGFLLRTARGPLVVATLLATGLSLTEGVGLAAVFPVLALLQSGGSGLPAGRWMQGVFRTLAWMHVPRGLWLAALLMVVLVSMAVLTQLNAMLSTLTVGLVLRTRERLAERVFRAILEADWVWLTRRRSSDLTHLLTSELLRVGQLCANLVALLSSGMVAVLMLGVALYLAPVLTGVVVVGFGLLLPWQRRTSRVIYRAGDEISDRMADVFNSSMERLQNLKVVKAYGAQGSELSLFSRRHGQVVKELVRNQWRSVGAARSFQLVSTALLCAVILLGLGPLRRPAGVLLIFLLAFVRATPRLNIAQSKVNELVADLPAYAQIEAFVAECEGHSEAVGVEAEAPRLTREVRLECVGFRYGTELPVVLEGVDLRIAAGTVTAVAGLSGAGKSTVADLVMGLLLPTKGAVTVDGTRLERSNARAWRAHVGYVSQDTLLFHDTVRENLLWARPGASDAELEAAIAAANAGFVYGLAKGLHTVVGDRGMMLSHGQRQRIALARAFLVRPELLILDEATNSLDVENEEAILRDVRVRGAQVTTLLISHRPTALRFADKVYVLEGGRVAREGSAVEVAAALASGGG